MRDGGQEAVRRGRRARRGDGPVLAGRIRRHVRRRPLQGDRAEPQLLYSSFGDKDALYLRCLDRYAARYGDSYDQALSRASEEPLQAVRAFFEVTLQRIADPDVPDGCLVAQTAMSSPALSPAIAARATEALGLQCARLRTALGAAQLAEGDADDFAVHLAAVNQSLAVMSRAGTSQKQLRTVVDISMRALSHALPARSR